MGQTRIGAAFNIAGAEPVLDTRYLQRANNLSDVSSVTTSVINLGLENAVTSVINDTNVTGSITGHVLTLGWTGSLAVSRGGTGNTSFTAGSVIFSNGTILTQDNSNFFWDNSTNRLGIGTASPSVPLHVYANAASANSIGINNDHLSGSSLLYLAANNTGTLTAGVAIYHFGSSVAGNDDSNTLPLAGNTLFTAAGVAGDFIFNSGSGKGYLFTSGTSVVARMQSDGKVGIGTASPSTLLHVGLAGTTLGTIGVAGNTSGLVTIQPAAVAGTWTFTLPTTGGTNKYALTTNGSGTSTWSQIDLTAAVTGILPLANGGTNASLTASNGGIFYSTASAGAILAGTATAGKVLQSGASTTPSWSTPTYPSASGTSGKFLISDGTNNVYSTSTIPTSAGATANKLLLSDGTNYVLSTPTFPNASATSGKLIISDGTNWIASTTIWPNALTTGSILFATATNTVGQDNANLFWDDTNNKLGINNTTPQAILDVGVTDSTFSTYGIHLGSNTRALMSLQSASATVGNASTIVFDRYRGTIASPSTLNDGDQIAQFYFVGYTDARQEAAIIKVTADTGWGATGADAPTKMTFWTTPDGSGTASERLTILSSGNVGIGTTSPDQKLEVESSTAYPFRLTRTATGSFDFGVTAINTDVSTFILDATTTTQGIAFRTRNSSNTQISALVINNDGKIGIGKIAPNTTLDVSGIITTNNYYLLRTAADTGTASLLIRAGTLGVSSPPSVNDTVLFAESGFGLGMATNGSATLRMYISTAGHVAIGGTSANLNSQTRELVVSAGTSGAVNAGISIQGSATDSSVFTQINFFHQSTNVALMGSYRNAANDAGGLVWYTKATGVGIAETMRLDVSGNLGLGITGWGTSAAKVLGIGNGTEPSTSPADMVQLYSVDLSAGNATLGLRTETGVVTESVVSDRTLSVRINGTTYKICLKV